jgi:hypothetical protein
VWCRKRPMHRSGRPLGPASVQTYFYAVSDCFKWAARELISELVEIAGDARSEG